ncbi:MAG: histidine--tRNA ligase, partial [Anaerolineales bacterium]|nr:histidine--tRNA ligase [Anaerolineales bacterium]
GRYDGLAEAIGGPSVPGVGFGSGIERIILALREQGVTPPALEAPQVFIAHFGGETKRAAVKLAYQLRDAGIGVRMAFARDKRSMKSQMREANKYDVDFVLILGEDEVTEGVASVRFMKESGQETVALADLAGWLEERLA